MKFLKAPLAATMAGVSVLGLSLVAAPADTQAQSQTSTPIDVWALRPVVDSVRVSPDGKHLLVHKIEAKESDYLIEIYSTDNLSEPLRRLAGDRMELISANWVGNNYIYGSAWQFLRKNITRQEQDPYGYEAFFYNLEKNKFIRVDGNFGLVSTLPNDPDHILVSEGKALTDRSGSDPLAAFRPRNYYKFNLDRGSRELVMAGNIKYTDIRFDVDGNPRGASGFDNGVVKFYFRRPGENSWNQYDEIDLDDTSNFAEFFSNVGLQGFDPDNPDIGYVIGFGDGEDTAALYEFDFTTGQYGKKLFQHESADVIGIQTHSIPGNNRLAAAIYPGEKYERHWFNEDEKALYEALEQQIPYAHQIQISSRSLDGKTMIVTNVGPRDPGSFWLVKDGKLAKLGSSNPLLNPEQLADVKFVRYPARDGMDIPAYITVPKGEPPFPLVVLPHGGPVVNEVVLYDEWAQLLASQGYMVIQPQYRISLGWGKKHLSAGLYEFGEKMQDDKDDGALWLVEQGLVDPDRIAMFGWSYGGYAALVSLSRDPNIYQCAIAGAAVANYPRMAMERRSNTGILDEYFDKSYGVNPMEEVSKVNIPLLMIHPRQDMRVRYFNLTDYKGVFEKAGKEGQFLTLEEANHFSNTLMYRHQQQLYTKMLDFLANDCGPGGL